MKSSSKYRIYCPVCRLHFVHRGKPATGEKIICTICGARLELTAMEPEPVACRYEREPAAEIRDRAETFARLRGYTFNEEKENLLAGLVEKNRLFGDFYCPCRFEHEPEYVCPCLETRMNDVRKEGSCY